MEFMLASERERWGYGEKSLEESLNSERSDVSGRLKSVRVCSGMT